LSRCSLALARCPSEKRWLAEPKWGGCRLHVRFDGRRLRLRTRPGRDYTASFPSCIRSLKRSPGGA
jgi:ATP-dependent DNA ligase